MKKSLGPLPALVLSVQVEPGRWSLEKLPGDLNVHHRFRTTDLHYLHGAIINFCVTHTPAVHHLYVFPCVFLCVQYVFLFVLITDLFTSVCL